MTKSRHRWKKADDTMAAGAARHRAEPGGGGRDDDDDYFALLTLEQLGGAARAVWAARADPTAWGAFVLAPAAAAALAYALLAHVVPFAFQVSRADDNGATNQKISLSLVEHLAPLAARARRSNQIQISDKSNVSRRAAHL